MRTSHLLLTGDPNTHLSLEIKTYHEGQRCRCRNRRWPRHTPYLRQGFTKTIESLALEEDLDEALGQQGVDTEPIVQQGGQLLHLNVGDSVCARVFQRCGNALDARGTFFDTYWVGF